MLVRFLGEVTARQFCFEINWPLGLPNTYIHHVKKCRNKHDDFLLFNVLGLENSIWYIIPIPLVKEWIGQVFIQKHNFGRIRENIGYAKLGSIRINMPKGIFCILWKELIPSHRKVGKKWTKGYLLSIVSTINQLDIKSRDIFIISSQRLL